MDKTYCAIDALDKLTELEYGLANLDVIVHALDNPEPTSEPISAGIASQALEFTIMAMTDKIKAIKEIIAALK